jgi:hypothetical protein
MSKNKTKDTIRCVIVDSTPLSEKWMKKGAMAGVLTGAACSSYHDKHNLKKAGVFALSIGLLGGAAGFFAGKILQKRYPRYDVVEKRIKKLD